MKKIAIILAGASIILVVVLLVARHLALGFLTPDFLVQEIEKRWTCRAEVEGLKVRLWGQAGLELKGVKLGPVDEFVTKGTPLAERPAMEGAEVSADLAKVEVEVGDLLQRRINIGQLLVQDVTVETKVGRDGRASVQDLFESPDRKPAGNTAANAGGSGGKSVPTRAVKGAGVVVQVSGKPDGEEGDLSSKNLEVSAFADHVEIRNGKIVATLESGSSRVTLSSFQLKLSQIEVDSNDLLKHNHAAFSFSGDLVVEEPEAKVKQISISMAGDGEVRPFDPVSGKIDPQWVSDLTIKKGSAINTFPMIEKLRELLSGVDTAGVDLDDLQIRGDLTRDASTRIAGHAGKFELKKNLVLPLTDTDFIFAAGSWLDSGADQHRLRGAVMASDELTAKLTKKVDDYLRKKAKGFYSDSLTELVLQPAMRDGRIAFDFVSEGDLGDPEVDILTPFGNLSDLIDQGKETIKNLKDVGKSLLKGLFGK